LPRDHCARKRCLACQLSLNVRLTLHPPSARPEREDIYLNAKLVAGSNGTPELGSLDAREDNQLICPVAYLGQQQNASSLGHRFDYQHTGHNWVVRKMARKKWLIDSHILNRYNSLCPLKGNYPIDQQERVAVGQIIHDLPDVQYLDL
jgi:hypothetical protein